MSDTPGQSWCVCVPVEVVCWGLTDFSLLSLREAGLQSAVCSGNNNSEAVLPCTALVLCAVRAVAAGV